MPGLRTVYDWLDREESFSNQIARARRLQAHTFVDELQEIIAICRDMVDGGRGGTMEQIQAAKVCADNYRWIAGKALPAVYGDFYASAHGRGRRGSGRGEAIARLYFTGAARDDGLSRMLAKMEQPGSGRL